MTANLFNINSEEDLLKAQVDPDKDYLEELVGEGKVYSDQKALARALMEKELHIKRIENENKGMRDDMQSRKNIEDLLTELKTSKTEGNDDDVSNQNGTPAAGENTSITPEDIDKLVEERLSKREREISNNKNLELVKNKIQEVWGAGALNKLRDAQKELDLTEAEVNEFAMRQPKALIRALGLEGAAPQKPADNSGSLFTNGNVNSASMGSNNSGTRNYAYYQKMRKENPTLYYDPKTQLQMHNEAIREGEKFFAS